MNALWLEAYSLVPLTWRRIVTFWIACKVDRHGGHLCCYERRSMHTRLCNPKVVTPGTWWKCGKCSLHMSVGVGDLGIRVYTKFHILCYSVLSLVWGMHLATIFPYQYAVSPHPTCRSLLVHTGAIAQCLWSKNNGSITLKRQCCEHTMGYNLRCKINLHHKVFVGTAYAGWTHNCP